MELSTKEKRNIYSKMIKNKQTYVLELSTKRKILPEFGEFYN